MCGIDDTPQDGRLDNSIDMTGVWLVNFGYGVHIEGSAILTLSGLFDKDDLLDNLSK